MSGLPNAGMIKTEDGKVSKVRKDSCWLFAIRWAVSLMISSLLLFSCENSEGALREWSENKTMVEEARDITTLFSQRGQVKAKLTSPLMLRFQSDTIYVEFPKSLHVDFFDSTGQKESQVDALYGKYFESLNKVFLRDSVMVATVKGDTLRCPELWWDQATGKFYTDKFVRIKTVDKLLYGGRGMEADQDLSNVTIYKPTGVVAAPDGLQQ
jgi:LPS export ABC transporter protein LptC